MNYINPEFNIIYLDEINSTNTYAKNLAKKGEKEGTVVIANRQTEGRGRLGRSFFSPKDTGIYMSIILRPKTEIQNTLLITTLAAVSVSMAIESVTGKETRIKWVNDVYVDKKKVCGILTEGSFKENSSQLEYAVLGIGINISNPQEGFPDDIRSIAGYLCENSEKDTKEKIIEKIINNFFEYYKNITKKPHLEYYTRKNMLLGKNINIIKCDQIISEGVCMGIDDDFHLIYENNNERFSVSSGEVSVREKEEL